MAVRQVANCINETLNKRSDCNQQSREKKRGVNRDPETDGKSNQHSRRRWFQNCQ